MRALCPEVVGRAVGDYASVVAFYRGLGDGADVATRRAALCAPETTDRAFAHGTFGLALDIAPTDQPGALALIEALAREYAEPQALGELASAHAAGAGGLPLDIGAAYCEAWAAMTIANSIGAVDGDRSFSSALLGTVMPFVSIEPAAMGAGPEVTTETIQACVAVHIARWEAHFGHVMSDHEINEAAHERARAMDPPLDDWWACPCEQMVETADGAVCPGSVEWRRGEDGPELCMSYRTHAPATEDVEFTLELRWAATSDEPPDDQRVVPASEGRSGAARRILIRMPRPPRNTSIEVMDPEGFVDGMTAP